MDQSNNKTIMCSVFFLDIVGYSKRSVAGQISLKERFNAYLSAAIRDVPLSDRIILDTGDGAAINFMGDIEDALKAALSMRSSMLLEDPNLEPPLLVRMGVNLGPVRLIRDINGQPNIVGDGINVAQRVMGFADASQILVSRSYFDAVSRLSPQYINMFHYQGSRTDKHVREHEVYAIGYPGDKTTRPVMVQDGLEKKSSGFAKLNNAFAAWFDVMLKKIEASVESLFVRYRKIDPVRRAIYVALAGVPVVLATVIYTKSALREQEYTPIQVKPRAVARVPKLVQPVSGVSATSMVAAASGVAEYEKPIKKKLPKKPLTSASTTDITAVSRPKKMTDKEKADLAANHANSKLLGFSGSDDEASRGKIAVGCIDGTLLFIDGANKGKMTGGEAVVEVASGRHTVIVMLPDHKLFNQSVDVPAGKMLKIRPHVCK